jgi:hypothetical protein
MGSEGEMIKELLVLEMSDSWMYLSNRKSLWYEFLENWIFFWVIYVPIVMTFYFLYEDTNLLYRAAMLLLSVWCITAVRRYIKHLSLFILLNSAAVATAFLIGGGILERIVFSIVLLIYVITSFKIRYSEVVSYFDMTNLIFSELFLAACYIAAFNLGMDLMVKIVTGCGIVVALSSALYLHLTRTQKLMEWESQFARKFSTRIQRLKIIFSAAITGFISFLIWLSWKLGIFRLLDELQNRINGIFGGKTRTVQRTPPKIESPRQAEGDMFEKFRMLGSEESNSIFIKIVFKIIEIILVLIVAVAVIYLLRMIVLKLKELYLQFYSKSQDKSEEREVILSSEEITKEINESLKRIKSAIGELVDRTNEKKIRRIYSRIIYSSKLKGIEIVDSDTPGELEGKIHVKTDKDLRVVTELYNKARYSQHSCSDQDVERVKKYL